MMERTSFFDALVLGGVGILVFTFFSFISHNQLNQIWEGGNGIVILAPVIIIMIGLIFRLEGLIQETNPNMFNKKELDLKNKEESKVILKKYESMPDLTQQNNDSEMLK